MRLWSLHPRYLDPQGLVALWRESLLAQAVLAGRTRGYTRHPQLERFQGHADPMAAIGAYLRAVQAEATARGYAFDAGRIISLASEAAMIVVSHGQLAHERSHLLAKLQRRNPDYIATLADRALPDCHPLFAPEPGDIASWERH